MHETSSNMRVHSADTSVSGGISSSLLAYNNLTSYVTPYTMQLRRLLPFFESRAGAGRLNKHHIDAGG